jgi:hypothetical protein
MTIKRYFSPSTVGFYSDDLHAEGAIPGDAVEITEDRWIELLREQESGKRIVAGVHRHPVAIDHVMTPEERQVSVLRQRDQHLQSTDGIVARHRDEVEDGGATTLTNEQFRALQSWRRALRDITTHPEFPNVSLPERPV